MNQLTEDNNPDVQNNNEYLAILAQAFQQIACDANFLAAIGQAIDADLECSVEHFLENNQSYKTTVNTWLTSNGHGNYLSLLTGLDDKPWIYAANYGVHSQIEPPILALSIELDSTILDENDDFIPCYFAESDCGSYETKLIGLRGDLGPEEPSLPTRALTLVFSAEAEEAYNKKERKDLGDVTGLSGTVIDPGTGSTNCEYANGYEISEVYVTQKFNKSKKVKVATRFVASDNCNTWPVGVYHFGSDKIIQGKNILNQVHSTNYNLQICPYNTFTCNLAYKDAIGVVFEKDWYSGKWISGTYTSSNCPGQIRYWEIKVKSYNVTEIYAYFAFTAIWCIGEVREFNVPTNRAGDHAAHIRIKAKFM